MTQQTVSVEKQKSFNWVTALLLILPLILLGGVIALFLSTGGGLQLTAPAPIEALTVERTILKPNSIDIIVRNTGPEELTIAQATINEAIWPITISPGPT